MSAIMMYAVAACSGATIGLFAGTLLRSGKLRDLELAYCRLSEAIHRFLQRHPLSGRCKLVPLHEDDLRDLQKSLAEADVLAGLRESTDR